MCTIYLPAGSTWRVEETIFLDDFQELATVGYPAGDDMAILEAQEGLHGHLLHAFDKSGIRIRNVVIDGNKVRIIPFYPTSILIMCSGEMGMARGRCRHGSTRRWKGTQSGVVTFHPIWYTFILEVETP